MTWAESRKCMSCGFYFPIRNLKNCIWSGFATGGCLSNREKPFLDYLWRVLTDLSADDTPRASTENVGANLDRKEKARISQRWKGNKKPPLTQQDRVEQPPRDYTGMSNNPRNGNPNSRNIAVADSMRRNLPAESSVWKLSKFNSIKIDSFLWTNFGASNAAVDLLFEGVKQTCFLILLNRFSPFQKFFHILSCHYRIGR